MSTAADWDADVDAEIVAAIDAAKLGSNDNTTPTRSDSDLRNARMEPGNYRYQIRHAQQGEDSALASGQSLASIVTGADVYHRLGTTSKGGGQPEEERDYTVSVVRLIQAQLLDPSTWREKASVRRLAEPPAGSIPTYVRGDVIAFSVDLAVELAP